MRRETAHGRLRVFQTHAAGQESCTSPLNPSGRGDDREVVCALDAVAR
jgi:hypothetical protein